VVVVALSAFGLAACGNREPQSAVIRAAEGSVSHVSKVTNSGEGASATSATSTTTTIASATGPVGSGVTTTTIAGTPTGAVTGSSKTGNTATGTNTGPVAASGSGPATGTPIKIGNIGEYSGVVGSSFGSAQQMVPVVVKWINAHGGLNGHPIQLYEADDQSDPSTYLSEAEQMVQEGVVAFMGNLVPISGPGAEQYLDTQEIPIVGGDGAASIWATDPDMYFAGTTFQPLILAGALYAKAIVPNAKFALFYCVEAADACGAFQRSLASSTAVADGVSPVYTAQISLAQPSFTAECINAQNAGANVLMLAMDANSLIRAGESCAAQGYHPQILGASVEVVNSLASVSALNGFISPEPMFPWTQSDNQAEVNYQSAINEYSPGLEGSAATAAEWVSGMLLQAASQSLPATNPTAAQIKTGLYALKNTTLGGIVPPTTFTAGKPSPNQNCYYIVQIQNAKWVAPKGSTLQCP
jgi:branched-chain amino acid transport system substrate-binding protein